MLITNACKLLNSQSSTPFSGSTIYLCKDYLEFSKFKRGLKNPVSKVTCPFTIENAATAVPAAITRNAFDCSILSMNNPVSGLVSTAHIVPGETNISRLNQIANITSQYAQELFSTSKKYVQNSFEEASTKLGMVVNYLHLIQTNINISTVRNYLRQ